MVLSSQNLLFYQCLWQILEATWGILIGVGPDIPLITEVGIRFL